MFISLAEGLPVLTSGLNPFEFRARVYMGHTEKKNGLSCLNPFEFRARVYMKNDQVSISPGRLNPFEFRARVYIMSVESLAADMGSQSL